MRDVVDEGGIGALQISAAFKDSAVLDSDLRDFALDHLDAGAATMPVEAGDFSGFAIAYDEGERSWQCWHLRHGRQILHVTYNCRIESRGVHDGTVQAVLASLSATDDDVA